MSEMIANSLQLLQLEDARRACMTAAASLRLVTESAAEPLRSHAQRLHDELSRDIDELADISLRARTSL